jgi:hypothetical protein
MRRYVRIDSLRRHVLRIHLNQASRHDYGLRGLPQPPTATEDGPIICPEPACNGLVLQGQMHCMSHSAKVHEGAPLRSLIGQGALRCSGEKEAEIVLMDF